MKIAPVSTCCTQKNTLNFINNKIKPNVQNVKKTPQDTNSKVKAAFIGLNFLILAVCLAEPFLRKKSLEFEGALLKKNIKKANGNMREIVSDFQKKADEVSNLIKQGLENSFEDVYEDSKLVRKFVSVKDSKFPKIMEEYSKTSGELFRRTGFLDSENFNSVEYRGTKDFFDLIKVRKNKLRGIYNGVTKNSSSSETYDAMVEFYQSGKVFAKNCFLTKGKDGKKTFKTDKIFAFMGENDDIKSVFKRMKSTNVQVSFSKSFVYKNDTLSGILVDSAFEEGYLPSYMEFYKRNKEGKMIGIKTREFDLENLDDYLLCEFFEL